MRAAASASTYAATMTAPAGSKPSAFRTCGPAPPSRREWTCAGKRGGPLRANRLLARLAASALLRAADAAEMCKAEVPACRLACAYLQRLLPTASTPADLPPTAPPLPSHTCRYTLPDLAGAIAAGPAAVRPASVATLADAGSPGGCWTYELPRINKVGGCGGAAHY